MPLIYIVDDEPHIRRLASIGLRDAGFETAEFSDGGVLLHAMRQTRPDAVLLDWMMPGQDGIAVLGALRSDPATRPVPILMMTARTDEVDRVLGLEMGADDYITKPFEMRELIARVHAVLRRFDDDETPAKLEFDNLIIDKESYNIVVKGQKMEIPPKEIELLYFLASSPNRVFTRSQLLDDVWGFDYFGDTRTVDVHIKRLREKLTGVSDKWELKTVWGVGYKFETKN